MLRVPPLIPRPPEQLGAVTAFRNEGRSTTEKFQGPMVCCDLRRRYRRERLRDRVAQVLRVLQAEPPLRLLRQGLDTRPRSSEVHRPDRL